MGLEGSHGERMYVMWDWGIERRTSMVSSLSLKVANNVSNGNGRARWVAAGRDWDGLTDRPTVCPF